MRCGVSLYQLSGDFLPSGDLAAWLLGASGVKVYIDIHEENNAVIEVESGSEVESIFLKVAKRAVEAISEDDFDELDLYSAEYLSVQDVGASGLNQVGGILVESLPNAAITEAEIPSGGYWDVPLGSIYEFVENFDHGLTKSVDFETYCSAKFRQDEVVYSVDGDADWPMSYGIVLHSDHAKAAFEAHRKGEAGWSAIELGVSQS